MLYEKDYNELIDFKTDISIHLRKGGEKEQNPFSWNEIRQKCPV